MATPMFPLGSVLLPGAALPLHVFEPRYCALLQRCLKTGEAFGVVLIERGSEVGGGETRCPVGTMADIVEAAELPGDRWAVVGVGTERCRVVEWLEDDPYPQAVVEAWPDPAHSDADRIAVDEMAVELRRVLALSAEMGTSVAPATTALDPDPTRACYQACALAPLGPADRYALLTASDVGSRTELLASLLAGIEGDLRRGMELDGPHG